MKQLIINFIIIMLVVIISGCSGSMFETVTADKNKPAYPNPLINISAADSGPTGNTVGSATYFSVDDTMVIILEFNEPVNLDSGFLDVTLSSGETLQISANQINSATSLNVPYLISAGENSSGSLQVTAVTVNGGTLTSDDGGQLDPSVVGVPNMNGTNYVIDTSPAVVGSISSTTADGYYNDADSINITFTLDEPVNITAGGPLQVTLDTGKVVDLTPVAPYDPITPWTQNFTGTYDIDPGQNSSDLNVSSVGLNGATVVDRTGVNPITAISLSGVSNISDTSAIVIDTTAPSNISVNSSLTANGTYGVGSIIQIEIPFATEVSTGDMVVAGGPPTLLLETGTPDREAAFSSVTGNVLIFQYTVQDGDTSADLDFFDTGSLRLNGGTITDAAGNAAVTTLPLPGGADSLSVNKDIVIDGVKPIVAITSPTDGSQVNGNAAISYTSDDTTAVEVSIDDSTWVATVNGVTTLSDITGFSGLAEGVIILYLRDTDSVGNIGTTSISLTKDTQAPLVSIDTPSNGAIVNGSQLIEFSTDTNNATQVSVDGTNWTTASSGVTVLGNIPQFAGLTGGNGFTLYFRDTDPAGNPGTTSINLTKDTSLTNPLTTISAGNPSGAAIVGAATYFSQGDSMNITLTFDSTVNLNSGTLDVTFNSGVTVQIAAAGINSTQSVVFGYTIGAGQNSSGALQVSSIVTNGDVLTDDFTTEYDLSLAGVTNMTSTSFVVDTTKPGGSSMSASCPSCPNAAIFPAGADAAISFVFDEPVTLTGTLEVTFDNAETITLVASGAQPTATFVGTYSIQASDTNTGDLTITDVNVSGGNIVDRTGDVANNAITSLIGLSIASGVAIDTSLPVVNITAPAASATVNNAIIISFTDDDTTTPQVSVDNTNWTSAASGVTTLGDIPQYAGLPNAAFTLYLRDTDTVGNVGTYSISITKDESNPTVLIATGESDPTNTTPFQITITFSEQVSGFAEGDISVGNGSVQGASLSTSDDIVFTANIVPVGNGSVTVNIGAGVCDDLLANPNLAATQLSIVYDGTEPVAPSGVSITQGAYHTAPSIDISFTNGTDANFSTHNIKACTDSGCSSSCVGASTDASSPATITGLINGSTYYACVQAVDNAGNTSTGFVASGDTVVIDTTDPVAPSGVSITQGAYHNATSIDISFTDGTDSNFSTHNIKACTDSGCSSSCVGVSTDSSSPATITGLINGSTYYACVQAVDLADQTSTGFVASGDTVVIDTTDPVAPSGVSITQGAYHTAASIDITFTNGTDANFSTHNIKACTDSGCSSNCVGASTDASSPASIGSLVNGNTYYACVQSEDIAGNTSTGFVASGDTVVIDTTDPIAPSGVSITQGAYHNSTTIDVTFTNGTDSNFSTHNIKACIDSGCSSSCVGASTDASSPASISSLVVGSTYYACVQSEDAAGRTSVFTASGDTVTIDTTPPTISIGSPSATDAKNGTMITYTVTYSDATIMALDNGDITPAYTGTATCSTINVVDGTTLTPDVQLSGCTGDGTAKITVAAAQASDDAGNTDAGAGPSTTFNVDNTNPVISSVAPISSASVNNTLVSYTFSEICDTGSITWTRTAGAADSNHAQGLTGSELNAGIHSNITITNNPTLVDTSVYTISFDCSDRAGNAATTVSSTGVTFTDSPLEITNAVTMDTDGDGKIDTYNVSFNKNVNDSTFPGYSLNALGTATSNWLVAGYTNVRLIHGTAVGFATDTVNDAVIYLRFDESLIDCNASSQAGCDSGAKPDLSTTASPGLQDLATNTISQVGTAAVTEADGAEPILVTAKSLDATHLDVIFSEAMEQTTAETDTYYTITLGVTVSSSVRDGSDYKTVHLITSSQIGGTTYTLTVNTDVKDLANFNLSSSANTKDFDGLVKPVVVNIVTVNATTLTITFNESVVASSAECTSLSTCALIYSNSSLPVKSAVSTAGQGNNASSYTLIVNTMLEGASYTTTVLENTVQSVASSELMGDVNNAATFDGDGEPNAVIHADTATACPGNGAQRVIVEYDQAVSTGATTVGNYTISLCITGDCATGYGSPNDAGASSVTSLGANQYQVDFTDTFDTDDSQYRLTIQNVQDASGNLVPSPTNLSFQCGNDNTAPIVIGADVVTSNINATRIMLTFSESVDQITANTASSYKYDSESYGANVSTAARQSNPSKVLVTFAPGLAEGGHQVRVQNVKDLAATANTIVDDGVNNVQPIIVNAPDSFGDGSVFEDPFNDGTQAMHIVKYDSKLYLGADTGAAKLFEIDYGLTTSRTITMDSDGTPGMPIDDFLGDITGVIGATGVDFVYSACVGSGVDKYLTGASCSSASGDEFLFIGSRNTGGSYDDLFYTQETSSSTTTFTFEHLDGLESAGNTFRLGQMHMFKGFLYIANGDKGSGGPPYLTRVCMIPGGCDNAEAYLTVTKLMGKFITRIGKSSYHDNSAGEADQKYANIDSLYEYDADKESGNNDCTGATDCESQLYLANGGWCPNCNLSNPRTGTTTDVGDGGIIRTTLKYSKSTEPPPQCPDAATCDSDDAYSTTKYYDDVTPASSAAWYSFVSIPPPLDTADEWQELRPINTPVPSMWAVPYMRKAPNGDLYIIRNACTTASFQTDTTFRDNGRQVCPPGSEVTQLWMMKSCASSSVCPPGPSDWELVAKYSTTSVTNMQGNDAILGTNNTHLSLLEFVGNYIYIGFDNATDGVNIWRADMSGITSGTTPAEGDFSIVNIAGLDGTVTNQKLFSHITINDNGTDWLILTTRDGANAVQIYRTANTQD